MSLREVKYTAVIIESERGWGQRVDEVKEFDSEQERDDFIRQYNSQNTAASAPDWYMKAEVGKTVIAADSNAE